MTATKALVTERADRPAPLSHTQMHAQHQQWRGENAFWRDEIAIWQEEVKKARADIESLTKALADHEATVQKHAAAIRLYEQDMVQHEHALAEYEQGGVGENLFALEKTHGKESDKHAEQRALHETMKRDHHTVIAHWNLLLKGLIKTP